MDLKKFEKEIADDLAPTAEMQIGETDVQQLAKDTDFGGRSTEGLAGKVRVGCRAAVPSTSIR